MMKPGRVRDVALHNGEGSLALREQLHAFDRAIVGAGDQRYLVRVLRIVSIHDCSPDYIVVESAWSGEQTAARTGGIAKIASVAGVGAGGDGTGCDRNDCEQEQEWEWEWEWEFDAAWHWRLRWTPGRATGELESVAKIRWIALGVL